MTVCEPSLHHLNNYNPMNRKESLVLLAAALVATSAHGQLVIDQFQQPTGNLGGQGGGIGWGGNWTAATGSEYQVISTGLSYPGLLTAGGSVQDALSTHTVSVASRSMGDQSTRFVDGATLWFSFLLQPGSTFNNWGMAIASGNSSGLTGGFGMNVSSNGFTARAGGSSSATTTFSWTAGTTYVVVGQMTVSLSGNETTSIWLNPTNLGGVTPLGGTTATVSGNVGTLPGTNAFFAFQGGNQAQQFGIDEIRYGLTYAGVTPVPEPSTLSLAALGLVAALVAKKRLRPRA